MRAFCVVLFMPRAVVMSRCADLQRNTAGLTHVLGGVEAKKQQQQRQGKGDPVNDDDKQQPQVVGQEEEDAAEAGKDEAEADPVEVLARLHQVCERALFVGLLGRRIG